MSEPLGSPVLPQDHEGSPEAKKDKQGKEKVDAKKVYTRDYAKEWGLGSGRIVKDVHYVEEWAAQARPGFRLDNASGARITRELREEIERTPLWRKTVKWGNESEIDALVADLTSQGETVFPLEHFEQRGGREMIKGHLV